MLMKLNLNKERATL